jgi:hypothetical protein
MAANGREYTGIKTSAEWVSHTVNPVDRLSALRHVQKGFKAAAMSLRLGHGRDHCE